MADNRVYNAPDTIVQQIKKTLYYTAGDQALYEWLDVHCTGYEWVLVHSQQNDTDSPTKLDISYTTQLKVTEGSETETHFEMGGAFEGLSMSVGGSYKMFHSEETTKSKTVTFSLPCDAHKTTYFYQKRFVFQPIGWFVLDAWNEQWTVGSQGGYKVSWIREKIQIDSTDTLTTNKELSGSGATTITSAPNAMHPYDWRVRKYENCTGRCKDFLRDRGVKGNVSETMPGT